MNKVYKSFSEFYSENKTVLKLLGKNDTQQFYQAIWNAREGELENLREELLALKKQVSLFDIDKKNLVRRYDSQLESSLNTIAEEKAKNHSQNLNHREQIQKLIQENDGLKQKLQNIELNGRENDIKLAKSYELIAQLELCIEKQKVALHESEKTELFQSLSQESLSLHHRVKELEAQNQLLEVDLSQYKSYHEQGRRYLEQQDTFIEKLKANSQILKDLAEKTKNDLKLATEELNKKNTLNFELEKRLKDLQEQKLHLEKTLVERNAFIEELKQGVRELKGQSDLYVAKFKDANTEILNYQRKLETFAKKEIQYKNELQLSQKALETFRFEKERLANELQWLNNTVTDVQNSLVGIGASKSPRSHASLN